MSLTVEKNGGLYWEEWSTSIIRAWIELIINTLNVIIILVILIIYTVIFVNKDASTINDNKRSSKYLNPTLKYYLLLSLIVSALHIWGNYYFGCLSVLVFNIRYPNNCFNTVIINTPTIMTQRILIYTFFLKRLKNTFSNSVYQLSNNVYYIIIILLLASIIPISVIIVYVSYQINAYKCSGQSLTNTFSICVAVAGASDIFWATVITIMFISKLKSLVNYPDKSKIEAIMKKLTLLSMCLWHPFQQYYKIYHLHIQQL